MQPGGNEIEELSAYLQRWSMEVIRLDACGEATRLSCRRWRTCQILHIHTGTRFSMHGTVPLHQACAVLSRTGQNGVRLLGHPLQSGECVFGGPSAPIDLYIPDNAEVFILAAGLKRPAGELRIVDAGEASAQLLDALANCMARSRMLAADARSLTGLLQHIAALSSDLDADRLSHIPRVKAAMHARRLIEHQLPDVLTLGDLVLQCGVSERTLEYGFRQLYETTPLRFIRNQRLTRTHLALLAAKRSATVSQIARTLGFTHMGQYSRDYRQLFGETPSATLARGMQRR